MPIYEEEGGEELEKLKRYNRCLVCGEHLTIFYDMDMHKPFLVCNDWRRTQHEGIEREASRYEKEGLASLNIETRREIMNQEYEPGKTKTLAKYMGGGAITKQIATDIVESLWGKAPVIEKTKCILLCQTYQLNPLMKHLYLVGYKRKVDGKLVVDREGNQVFDWSIQIGIGATRLLAQRKHNYSYLDMTPRKATKAEIEKILGDTANPSWLYGFVWIKDVDTGAEAFGLRGIPKNENIKGQDKGNTHLNMACVRAERLALDRQYPGEMPPNVEVVDERYMETNDRVVDIPEIGKVIESTGEIIDSTGKECPDAGQEPESTHYCEEHNCDFELKKSRYGSFYAHKLPDGKWCNEKKKKDTVAAKTEEAAVSGPPPEGKEVEEQDANRVFEQTEEKVEGQEIPGAGAEDLAWNTVRTKLSGLLDKNLKTVDSLCKTAKGLGGLGTSLQEIYESLNDEGREKFIKEITTE